MPVPPELTFGVFDAAAVETLCPSPILLMCQVQVRANKVFASLIDGGSRINPNNATSRYLTRSTTTAMNCCSNGEIPAPGDVVKLIDYSIRRMSGKSEIVFVIPKMQIIRHCIDAFVGLQSTSPYPYDTAPEKLAALSKNDLQFDQVSGFLPENLHLSDIKPPLPESGTLKNELASKQNNYMSLDKTSSFTGMSAEAKDELQPNYTNSSPAESFFSNMKYEEKENVFMSMADKTENVYNSTEKRSEEYDPIRKETSLQQQRAAPYAPQFRQSGAVARRIDGQFIQIKNLTPFLGRWVIKGRFINVGEPRTYSNSRGEGKIWNLDIMDSLEPCGLIRCTFFNKAADKFNSIIKENEVYTVSRGVLKPANRKFNSGHHQFEIQLGEDAEITHVSADDPDIPLKPKISISRIQDLVHLPKSSIISVCGYIIYISELSEIITRTSGTPTVRREITILDDSRMSISVTLWGKKAQAVPTKLISIDTKSFADYPIVLIEHARIDEYHGRKISSLANTELNINPVNHPSVIKLKQWGSQFSRFEELESQITSLTTNAWLSTDKPNTDYVTISKLKSKTLDSSERDLDDRGLWFMCTATLLNIEKDRQFFWTACPTCGKKATSSSLNTTEESYSNQLSSTSTNLSGFCSYCNKDVNNITRKYILNVEIADYTGSLKCLAVADKGLALMGNVSADYLVSIQNKGYEQHQRYEDYFLQRLHKEYVFKIQAKSETYRDETRIRYRIYGIDPLTALVQKKDKENINDYQTCQSNLRKECQRLIQNIKQKLVV